MCTVYPVYGPVFIMNNYLLTLNRIRFILSTKLRLPYKFVFYIEEKIK